MMKANLIHGLIAGLLSAVAGVVYMQIYQNLNFVDFSMVMNSGAIIGSSIFGCMLMAIGYFLLEKFNKIKFKGIMNLLIILLSFLSILGPLMMSLPFEVEFPELFPALAIPMHFFPAMIFFGVAPFFGKKIN